MIIGRVYAMARPGRPAAEREAVRAAAAAMTGSAAQRARRLAREVAEQALADIDGSPAERVILLLNAFDPSPLARLALDDEIDTGAIIRAERSRRMEQRRWRRLPEAEWAAEDRDIIDCAAQQLAKRYQRHLCGLCP